MVRPGGGALSVGTRRSSRVPVPTEKVRASSTARSKQTKTSSAGGGKRTATTTNNASSQTKKKKLSTSETETEETASTNVAGTSKTSTRSTRKRRGRRPSKSTTESSKALVPVSTKNDHQASSSSATDTADLLITDWEVRRIYGKTFDKNTYVQWYAVDWKNWECTDPKSKDKWIGVEDLLPGSHQLLRDCEAELFEELLANSKGRPIPVRTPPHIDYRRMKGRESHDEKFRNEMAALKAKVFNDLMDELNNMHEITGIIAHVTVKEPERPEDDEEAETEEDYRQIRKRLRHLQGVTASPGPVYTQPKEHLLLVRWSNWKITLVKFSKMTNRQKSQVYQLLIGLRDRYNEKKAAAAVRRAAASDDPTVRDPPEVAGPSTNSTTEPLLRAHPDPAEGIPSPPEQPRRKTSVNGMSRYLAFQLDAISFNRASPSGSSSADSDEPDYLQWPLYDDNANFEFRFWPELEVNELANPAVRQHEMYICNTCCINCYNAVLPYAIHLVEEDHVGFWLPTVEQAEREPYSIGFFPISAFSFRRLFRMKRERRE